MRSGWRRKFLVFANYVSFLSCKTNASKKRWRQIGRVSVFPQSSSIYIYILMLSWWRRRRSFEQSWPSSRWAQRRFCPSPSSVSTQWPLLVPTMLGRNHGIKPFEWTNPGWLKGKHIYLNSYSLGRKNSGPILPKIGCHPFFWKNITIWVFFNMLPHNLSFFLTCFLPVPSPHKDLEILGVDHDQPRYKNIVPSVGWLRIRSAAMRPCCVSHGTRER